MESNDRASSSSSGETRRLSNLSEIIHPKVSPENSIQLDSEAAQGYETSQKPYTFFKRSRNLLAAKHPWLYSNISSVVKYIKGPRPKVELPDPVPLLGREYSIRGKTFRVGIEPALIRVTRPFTAPWLFVLLVIAYIISLSFLARQQWFLTPAKSFIECTSVFWTENAGCGINGTLCEPFSDSSFDFRCPAQCAGTDLANPRAIGNHEIDFVPLLVGGGDPNKTYRADSFICSAAIQAGMISNSKGGCASIQLAGTFANYLPTTANGLTSVGFPSIFPMSFRFSPSSVLTNCIDLRNYALAFNILVTCLLFFALRPKPIVLYWCLLSIGFWHITLFSEPQSTPPPLDVAFGAFLPTLFVGYAFWRIAFRFTLPALMKAPIEAAVWYLAPFWSGVLANLTMSKIPINTLTATGIKQQPGGLAALIIIIIILLVLVVNQVRVVRKTGWLPYYLGWYAMGGLVALVISQLPGLVFRLHHYIIAMALMPGCGFLTKPSAVYQGFLLGMFLNGVAAFGFSPILQTAADLVADGPTGSPLPTFLTNSTTYNTSIPLANQTISWPPLSNYLMSAGWTGFALIVDDVERYAGPALNYSLASLRADLPHFFRLAYIGQNMVGDFTMAATLWPNGTWINPLNGPS